jgi:hypothetical protein
VKDIFGDILGNDPVRLHAVLASTAAPSSLYGTNTNTNTNGEEGLLWLKEQFTARYIAARTPAPTTSIAESERQGASSAAV